MTTLQPYKGFQGSVEYDNGVLFIRILHIDDSVSTICDAASQVEPSFRELVDDYIETCRSLGQEPNRPFKGSFNVRIKPSFHRQAAMAAAQNEITLNSWIEEAIQTKLTDSFGSNPFTRKAPAKAKSRPLPGPRGDRGSPRPPTPWPDLLRGYKKSARNSPPRTNVSPERSCTKFKRHFTVVRGVNLADSCRI
jgi:predicted HicB family RNase H-like nuclease